jgi:seryl-tRNA synthetase
MRQQLELLNQQLQGLLQQNNNVENSAQQRAMAQRSEDVMSIKGEINRLGCHIKRMEAQVANQASAGGESQLSEN